MMMTHLSTPAGPGPALALGLALAVALQAGPALADQCAYLSVQQAAKAKAVLEGVAEIVEYCELCTGDTPKQRRIQDIQVRKVDDGRQREIYVDGQPIDLAYTFVPDDQERGRYKNLSKLAGCPSDSVSSAISFPPKGGPNTLDWSGRYAKVPAVPVIWELTHVGSGPAYRAVVEFATAANGNDKGSMHFAGEIQNGQLTLKTPVGTCGYTLSQDAGALRVRAEGGCGDFGPYLGGEFRRK